MLTHQKLNFLVPIEQGALKEENGNKEFLIKGTAINATTTRNGTKFISEQLERSAPTLREKPILKDHKNEIDSIVGTTTQNVFYDSNAEAIKFEARIVDKTIQEKIRQGLIRSVSVGAMVEELQRDEATNAYIAKGIDFVELSLVAVPADPNAGFAQAICESFRASEKRETIIVTKEEERTKMAEEAVKAVTVQEATNIQAAELEAVKAKLAEYIKKEEKAKMESAIRAEVEAEYKAKMETTKIAVPEAQVTTKAHIIQDSESQNLGIRVEKSENGRGWSFSRDYATMGAKRLMGRAPPTGGF